MTPEQKAAAERLRVSLKKRHVKFQSSPRTYLGDMELIVIAYLAQHPADDDEPIDEEFLRSVGFVDIDKNTLQFDRDLPVDVWHGGVMAEAEWSVGGERIPHELMPSTRGDLRRLASALGIELREAP